MKNIAGIFLALAVRFAHAGDWTPVDYTLLAGSSALWIADWSQTLYIARHPDQYTENNPFLGPHPSVGKVNIYFAAGLVGNYAVASVLPMPWRRAWLGTNLLLEVNAVRHNAKIGVRIGF